MDAKPVLIVDDEKNIRLTLSQSLAALDLTTETAVNGEEALAKLDRADFGLMLLDLKMPGMDGMEVLRRVCEKRPDIRVIIITAHGTIESAVEAMKLGAVDFLQKPFSAREIRELVRRVLDRGVVKAETATNYDEHIELAKKAINDRSFDAAREHLRQAIAVDSGKPEAFNLLGVLAEMFGDIDEARKEYRAALALDRSYKPADANLHRVVRITPGTTPQLGD